MGHFDMALDHQKAYLRERRRRGPAPGEPLQEYEARIATLQQRTDKLEQQVNAALTQSCGSCRTLSGRRSWGWAPGHSTGC
jgi:hypothetical protein